MKHMADCLFCRIIAKQIPCFKVYEDEDSLAFLDIKPVNPGHTLVVPKKHYDDFLAIPKEETEKMMRVMKKIAPAVLAGVKAQGFNLNLNNGRAAGQLISHLHWHIVPRFAGDGHDLWSGRDYAEGEAERILHSIRDSLADV